MPIPSKDERSLRQMIEEHEAWARFLSEPNLKKALDNLVDDERALNAAFEQPAEFMQEQGVEIPSDMEVSLLMSSPKHPEARRKWTVSICRRTETEVCCYVYHGGDWPPGQHGGHHICGSVTT